MSKLKEKFIGVDLKGHEALVVDNSNVLRFGQDIIKHRHTQYESYNTNRQVTDRNNNLIREQNQVTSNKVIEIAINAKMGIRMKDVDNPLRELIAQKAKSKGIVVEYMPEFLSSKICNKCGHIGVIENKQFTCPNKHTLEADVNTALNISKPTISCSLKKMFSHS